jgi:hypothetical protein
MQESITDKKASSIVRIVALVLSVAFASAAGAVEPEKQPIYANIVGGLLCGTSSTNQCKVPAGKRLIITYVSGFVFEPLSSKQNTVVTMAITDQQLGLNGAGFHNFPAMKVNTTSTEDVYAFATPLKMMLHPKATFYFSSVAGLAVSGYLVNSP